MKYFVDKILEKNFKSFTLFDVFFIIFIGGFQKFLSGIQIHN